MRLRLAKIVAPVVLCAGMLHAHPAWPQFPPAEIPLEELQSLAIQLQNDLPRVLIPEMVVETEVTLPSPGVYVRRLVFRPGGSFVIDGKSFRPEQSVLIVAKEIEVVPEAVGRPQVHVRWPPVEDPQPKPPGRPGEDGSHIQGQRGGNGEPGAPGAPGSDGGDAPRVIIVSDSIKGRVTLNLKGQQGGIGGRGGDGGRGGVGGHGIPASQSAFDCRRGPGHGGPGGAGGDAGAGGNGGTGGDGGAIFAIVPETVNVAETVMLRSEPGEPGRGGPPGVPGPGGMGGRAGQEALPWCRQTASAGATGAGGATASMGSNGKPGATGALKVGRPADLGFGVPW